MTVTALPAAIDARPSIPRAIDDFLIEFSVGLQKYGMYPDGHPLLDTAVSTMTQRLAGVLRDREPMVIGVARDRLIIDGAPTENNSNVLRDFAAKLFRREVGAIRFAAGVSESELTELLKFIARGTAPEAEIGWARITGLPSEGDRREHRWEHLELYPLNYTQLKLVDGEDANEPGDAELESGSSRLWQRLARSAGLVGATPGLPTEPMESDDPAVLAGKLAARSSEPGVAHEFFGLFTQLTEQIKRESGRVARAFGRRASDFVRGLAPEALERLLRLGGDATQRRQLLRSASHTLAADTVLDLARVVASSSNHTMSEALLMLLSKLARHADQGTSARRSAADEALRMNVRQLIDDWDGAALLPEDTYWDTLERLANEPLEPVTSGSVYEPPPASVVQMSLEIEVFGITAKHAVTEMVKQGKISELMAMADHAPTTNRVVWTLRRHLDNTRTVRRLLQDNPVDFEVLGRLVSRVGFPAATPLVDALEHEDDSQARWKLFEIIAQLGPGIGDIIVKRLPQAPWYLQRNLLLLMGRLPEWPAAFNPVPYTEHEDSRVRREAFALVLKQSDPRGRWTRETSISRGLRDLDERIVRAALTAAQNHGCPGDAVTIVANGLRDGSITGPLADLAVRTIAPTRAPHALKAIAQIAMSSKRRWFRRPLAEKTSTLLAALSALAEFWPQDATAQQVLALAARSKDADVLLAIQPSSRRRPVGEVE
ncbi:MAG: hypothetical protein M3081_22885 [Gemmatimonadota bacterium]|nr:hypothetical protein [Gemmatimonadota bacterium]